MMTELTAADPARHRRFARHLLMVSSSAFHSRRPACAPPCMAKSATIVEQRFDNPFDQPLEAIHLFPLPEDGAVTEVELRAGEMVVRAECRERGEAERTFEQARRDGHTAALVTAERDDVHTLRVTRIPAKATVTVLIVVVERIAWADGSCALAVSDPVIAPRHCPAARSVRMVPVCCRTPIARPARRDCRRRSGSRAGRSARISKSISSVARARSPHCCTRCKSPWTTTFASPR